MSYAIVVKVPEARETCFVATPFRPEFINVTRSVRDAARSIDLDPIELDVQHPGPKFTDTVAKEIRSTHVLVAVCSPEHKDDRKPEDDPTVCSPKPEDDRKAEDDPANPNVMFEVGFAIALGKPTLLLMKKGQKPPSNICNQDVLFYDPGDAENGHLQDQIAARLGGIMRRIGQHPLTDPTYEDDISVAEAYHWRILHPDWWRLFFRILTLAKTTHHEFQSLDSGYLDKLRITAEHIGKYHEMGARLEIPLALGKQLDDYWYDLVNCYRSGVERKVLNRWKEQSAEGDQCFNELLAFIGATATLLFRASRRESRHTHNIWSR